MPQLEPILSTTVAVTGDAKIANSLNAFPWQSYVLSVAGTGAISASATLEFGNAPTGPFFVQTTIAISGTTVATVGYTDVNRFTHVRSSCTTILGTGATLTVTKAT